MSICRSLSLWPWRCGQSEAYIICNKLENCPNTVNTVTMFTLFATTLLLFLDVKCNYFDLIFICCLLIYISVIIVLETNTVDIDIFCIIQLMIGSVGLSDRKS